MPVTKGKVIICKVVATGKEMVEESKVRLEAILKACHTHYDYV